MLARRPGTSSRIVPWGSVLIVKPACCLKSVVKGGQVGFCAVSVDPAGDAVVGVFELRNLCSRVVRAGRDDLRSHCGWGKRLVGKHT